jgi:hypothetical protein
LMLAITDMIQVIWHEGRWITGIFYPRVPMSCSILERCDFHSEGLLLGENKIFMCLLCVFTCPQTLLAFAAYFLPWKWHWLWNFRQFIYIDKLPVQKSLKILTDMHVSTSNLYIFVSYILKGKFLVEVY